MQDSAPRRTVTYQDIIDLPPNKVGEIINGELIVHPRPAPPHARGASLLGGWAAMAFDRELLGPGGWVIRNEPEFHFPHGQIVVPDHAGWRRELWAGEPKTAYFDEPPQWVGEWISPSTEYYDRSDKLEIYGANEIDHYWICDAKLETIEVYELSNGRYRHVATAKGETTASLPPFDAVPLDLALLWRN